MKKNKVNRYHRELYFPPWAEDSLKVYVKSLEERGGVMFSVHALQKVIAYSFEYGKQLLKYLLKSIKTTSFKTTDIFEFYSVDEVVQKACLRFSFEEFPVDLVLVISVDGTVITVFTIHKGDFHGTLDASLYEKES
jgi:hypothetical protein